MVIAALVKLNAIPIDGTWEFYNNIEEVATGLQVCTVIFACHISFAVAFVICQCNTVRYSDILRLRAWCWHALATVCYAAKFLTCKILS